MAYVFVHLLPDLGEDQEIVLAAAGERFSFVEYHVYLVALVGLAVFYGLERAAKLSRRRRRRAVGVTPLAPASSGCTRTPSRSTKALRGCRPDPRGAPPGAGLGLGADELDLLRLLTGAAGKGHTA